MKKILLIGLLIFIPQCTFAATQVIFLTSGTTWTVPSDWNNSNNTIEVIGGGGGGAGGDIYQYPDDYLTTVGGPGGGGGGYSKSANVSLTSGTVVSYSVGLGGSAGYGGGSGGTGGDTWFKDTATVLAKGGVGGVHFSRAAGAPGYGCTITLSSGGGGAGGSAGSGVGTTKYSGGNGGAHIKFLGGGGGGAGGPHGIGGNGGDATCGNPYGYGGAGGGAGGGGAAGGQNFSNGFGSDGGNNYAGLGAGTGGSGFGQSGNTGSAGGGGGGGEIGQSTPAGNGGLGGTGTDWDSSHGSGGGGGGSAFGSPPGVGGAGGNYGAGGGGGGGSGGWYAGGGPTYGGSGTSGLIVITYTPNSPPTTPVITGPTSGFTKTNYTYTFRSTDPDSDTIRYAIDWDGNGTIDEYVPALGYVPSGTTSSASHSWNSSNTQTFKARAQDSLGNTSGWASYTVNMSPNAPTVLLTVAPSSITSGQSSTLTWSSTNANSCTGTNFSTGGATAGSTSVSPTVTTTYTVTCTGAGGTASDSKTVTYTCTATNICSGTNVVNSCTGAVVQTCSYQCGGGACIPPPAPVPNPTGTGPTALSGHLQVRPSLVVMGDTTRVFWNVSNVQSCTAVGDNTPADSWTVAGTSGNGWTSTSGSSGKQSAPIVQRTTFRLTCTPFSGQSFTAETAVVNVAPVFDEQ